MKHGKYKHCDNKNIKLKLKTIMNEVVVDPMTRRCGHDLEGYGYFSASREGSGVHLYGYVFQESPLLWASLMVRSRTQWVHR